MGDYSVPRAMKRAGEAGGFGAVTRKRYDGSEEFFAINCALDEGVQQEHARSATGGGLN